MIIPCAHKAGFIKNFPTADLVIAFIKKIVYTNISNILGANTALRALTRFCLFPPEAEKVKSSRSSNGMVVESVDWRGLGSLRLCF